MSTPLSTVLAQSSSTSQETVDNNVADQGNSIMSPFITRGQAVDTIVKAFNLKALNENYINKCLKHADECFFTFSARSDYDGISFDPLILYPDVFPAYKYYDSINTATILDLVRGYEQDHSPFKPEDPITAIQAIKVVLGAADLIKWKEKFEITSEEQKEAVSSLTNILVSDPFTFEDLWWQWRYLAFALKAGIIDVKQALNSDKPIGEVELSGMITKTIALQNEAAKNSKSSTPSQ